MWLENEGFSGAIGRVEFRGTHLRRGYSIREEEGERRDPEVEGYSPEGAVGGAYGGCCGSHAVVVLGSCVGFVLLVVSAKDTLFAIVVENVELVYSAELAVFTIGHVCLDRDSF